MAIDFSTTWCCKERLKWNPYLANATGFSLAVINNFLLNKYFTFHDPHPLNVSQFMRFLVFAIIGLCINTSLLWLLQRYTRLHFYMAKLTAIGIVFFWNYFSNALFTFKQ
jgi:putative flippase GtrA